MYIILVMYSTSLLDRLFSNTYTHTHIQAKLAERSERISADLLRKKEGGGAKKASAGTLVVDLYFIIKSRRCKFRAQSIQRRCWSHFTIIRFFYSTCTQCSGTARTNNTNTLLRTQANY